MCESRHKQHQSEQFLLGPHAVCTYSYSVATLPPVIAPEPYRLIVVWKKGRSLSDFRACLNWFIVAHLELRRNILTNNAIDLTLRCNHSICMYEDPSNYLTMLIILQNKISTCIEGNTIMNLQLYAQVLLATFTTDHIYADVGDSSFTSSCALFRFLSVIA